jgi:hypothetical protein
MKTKFVIFSAQVNEHYPNEIDFDAVSAVSRNQFKTESDALHWLKHDSGLTYNPHIPYAYFVLPIYTLEEDENVKPVKGQTIWARNDKNSGWCEIVFDHFDTEGNAWATHKNGASRWKMYTVTNPEKS